MLRNQSKSNKIIFISILILSNALYAGGDQSKLALQNITTMIGASAGFAALSWTGGQLWSYINNSEASRTEATAREDLLKHIIAIELKTEEILQTQGEKENATNQTCETFLSKKDVKLADFCKYYDEKTIIEALGLLGIYDNAQGEEKTNLTMNLFKACEAVQRHNKDTKDARKAFIFNQILGRPTQSDSSTKEEAF